MAIYIIDFGPRPFFGAFRWLELSVPHREIESIREEQARRARAIERLVVDLREARDRTRRRSIVLRGDRAAAQLLPAVRRPLESRRPRAWPTAIRSFS